MTSWHDAAGLHDAEPADHLVDELDPEHGHFGSLIDGGREAGGRRAPKYAGIPRPCRAIECTEFRRMASDDNIAAEPRHAPVEHPDHTRTALHVGRHARGASPFVD